jgi:hypothetical protein
MDINQRYFRSDDLISSNPFDNPKKTIENNMNNFNQNNTRNNPQSYKKDTNQSQNRRTKAYPLVNFKPLLEKKHVFVINTIHRNFQLNDGENPNGPESLFNFQIKLNPSITTKEKTPIYKNNPTLFQNQTQKENGVLGDLNPLYNAKEDRGDIIGYNSIIFSAEKGCKIQNLYRNIIEFNLKKIEIPKKLIDYLNPSLQSLSVAIQELSGFNQVHTTYGNVENTTFVLEPFFFSTTSTLFKNDTPIAFPIPTNQFNKLSIEFSFPFQIKENIDTLVIEYCEFVGGEENDTNGSNLINFFTRGNSNLFNSGTKIKFENVVFTKNAQSNINENENTRVYNFLNTIVTSKIIFPVETFEHGTGGAYHILSFNYSELLKQFKLGEDNDIQDIFDKLSGQEEKALKYLTTSHSNELNGVSYTIVPKIINIDIQIQMNFELKTKEDM